MDYLKPLQLGSLKLKDNILYAPLAGCTDYPFRVMSSRFKPSLIFCEMVKMDALVRNDTNTYKMLDFAPSMHPIGAQICGSNVKIAKDAACIIEDLGFDVLDLNCGCPVDKVTKDLSGSGLLKHPDLIGDILHALVKAVSIPVTIKIRAGWDESSINVEEITRIAEEAGAKMLTVHGRTRQQGYKGHSNTDYILRAKCAAKKMYVIGNGDIFDGPSAKNVFDKTRCDGLLVARGTLGKPWIAEEIRSFLLDQAFNLSKEEVKAHILEHFSWIQRYHKPKKAKVDARRVGCWYIKDLEGTKELRHRINQITCIEEAIQLVEEYLTSLEKHNVQSALIS